MTNFCDGFLKGPDSAEFHSQGLNFLRDDLMFGRLLSPDNFSVARRDAFGCHGNVVMRIIGIAT